MAKGSLIAVIVAFAAYVLAANPGITGIPAHEWIGLIALVSLFAHAALHTDWVSTTFRSLFQKQRSAGRMGRLLLDALLLIALSVCSVSGLMISGDVLPALGLYATGYYFWNPLHAFSAKALLSLLLVHLVLNWEWVSKSFSRSKGGRNNERGHKRKHGN